MALSLHRTIPISLFLKKPGAVRAFAFDIELAVEAKQNTTPDSGEIKDVIDPESGMLVNLVRLDDWLLKLRTELQSQSLGTEQELLTHSLGFLQGLLLSSPEANKVILAKLEFHDRRQSDSFGWKKSFFRTRTQFFENHKGVFKVTGFFEGRFDQSQNVPTFKIRSEDPQALFDKHPLLEKIVFEHLVSRVRRTYQK